MAARKRPGNKTLRPKGALKQDSGGDIQPPPGVDRSSGESHRGPGTGVETPQGDPIPGVDQYFTLNPRGSPTTLPRGSASCG